MIRTGGKMKNDHNVLRIWGPEGEKKMFYTMLIIGLGARFSLKFNENWEKIFSPSGSFMGKVSQF